MILRECVTSYTTSCIVQSEKHEDLRDALICLCCELTPLHSPLSVVRIDPAPGFRALIDDPMLRKYHIQVEVGRIKNPNHSPSSRKGNSRARIRTYSANSLYRHSNPSNTSSGNSEVKH